MGMKPSPSLRVAHLASYLRELIRDVSEQGKVAKIEGNPVQVAAVAILSGSIAVIESMAQDIRTLAGGAKAQAQLARPQLERIAGEAMIRGAGVLLGKITGRK